MTKPKIDPKTNKQEHDEQGNPVFMDVYEECEVIAGEEIDPDYRDPFDLSEMRKEGVDISSLGYKWLKENAKMFTDWKTCGTIYQK